MSRCVVIDCKANNMSSPTEENSLSPNPNKSLDGDIIFAGDYINLNKTSDAVVDSTEDPLEKGTLITQPPSGDDDEQNPVDGEGKVADTLLPYKLPFSATRLSRSFVQAQTQMKMNTAVKKREKWLHDGNKWDVIVPDRKIPGNVKYMVVDIETHDWLPDHLVKDEDKDNDELRYGTGRVVEIAWKLFSGKDDCLESKQYLIKPYGTYKNIVKKATKVHGITTEYASKHGVDVDTVLSEFIDIGKNIPNDGFVVAHNMAHEHTVLTNSFNPNQRIVWNAVPKSDTHSVPLLKFLPEQVLIKYYGGSNLQWRKWGLALSELHRNISPDPEAHTLLADNAHFACTDVDMTWEIFQYYKLHAPSVLLTWLNRSGEPVKTMPSTPKGKLNAIGNWQEKASYEGDVLRAKKKRKYGLK